MKLFKKITAIILAVSAMSTFFCLPTSAATVVEWDGKSDILQGGSYKITKEIRVSDYLYIPEDTKISVKKGGSLIMPLSSTCEVAGTLSIAVGGLFINSGSFTLEESGKVEAYGGFQSSINGTLDLKGRINVYNQGDFRISSETSVYKTGYIYVKGYAIFLKSSNAKVSGAIETHKNGELHVQGNLAVTLSGSITNKGYMTVGRYGTLKNSGTVTLAAQSSYNRFGDVKNTKSGKFVDDRPKYEYETMTVSSLVDEPDAYLEGIDVSWANGVIDWKKVAASGVDFAMIRAARSGVSASSPRKVDIKFNYNIENALANGIDVGVYFFCYSTTVEDAVADAEFLVDTLKGYKITYPVVLDIEPDYSYAPEIAKVMEKMTADDYTEIVEAFFEVLMENGYFPMLYSYTAWFKQKFDTRILEKYAIWLAHVKTTKYPEPTYEGGYYMWQYSHKGQVSGISGDVDLNYCYRDFPSILKKLKLNKLT